MALYEQARLARQKGQGAPGVGRPSSARCPTRPAALQAGGWPTARPSALPSMLRTRCRRAGVPVFIPHAMRHYCASMLLEGGMPTKHVADWLGHTTTVMVETTYGHVIARLKGRVTEAQVISDALGLSQEAGFGIESPVEGSVERPAATAAAEAATSPEVVRETLETGQRPLEKWGQKWGRRALGPANRARFERKMGMIPVVFKTAAIDRSATSPLGAKISLPVISVAKRPCCLAAGNARKADQT